MAKKVKHKSFLQHISTVPNPDSIYWAGNQFSILAAVLLWGMWLCRLFSPLQWIKYVYRLVVTAHQQRTHKQDRSGEKNGSGRVNVPPLLCEIYFLLWMAFFALVYRKLLPVSECLVQWVTGLFLFESVVWVLYYTIFRRFFEARYSIYHELEYLSGLVLVILTQALCCALRFQQGFLSMLAGLLGAGTDSAPFLVKLLGVIVMAVVVSMIISAFPTEKVKQYIPKCKMFILGNGDVVKQRLLKALEKKKDQVRSLYTLPADGDPAPAIDSTDEYCRLLRDNVDHNSVVWIETPTPSHVPYLRELLEMPIELIALEKPISDKPEELEYVETLIRDPKLRDRIFFLNYYLLEKALPLTWLCHGNPRYLKYLEVDRHFPLEDWQARLGKLKKLTVLLLEGEDDRPWVENAGGQWLETFIHNVQLAALLTRSPYRWQVVSKKMEKHRNELQAQTDGAQLYLLQEKGIPENQQTRYLEACYENGRVYLELEEQSLQLELEGEIYRIRVSKLWTDRYAIMADLVVRVKQGQCTARETDGLYDELPVLYWMLEQQKDGDRTDG